MEITQEIIVHFRSQQRKWTIYFRFIYPGWSIIQLELLCGFEQRYLFIQLWGVKRVNTDCDPLESPFFLFFFSYYSWWINHNTLNTHNWIVLGHPPLWNILPIHQHFVSGLLLPLNNATLIDAHLIDVRWSQCSFDKFSSPCSDPHWIGSRLKCRNETFCWFNGPRLSKSSPRHHHWPFGGCQFPQPSTHGVLLKPGGWCWWSVRENFVVECPAIGPVPSRLVSSVSVDV